MKGFSLPGVHYFIFIISRNNAVDVPVTKAELVGWGIGDPIPYRELRMVSFCYQMGRSVKGKKNVSVPYYLLSFCNIVPMMLFCAGIL